MTVQEATRSSRITQKPQVAIMNAVHDLPVLAARDLGFFKDEGLDINFVTTPGMSQVTTKHFVKFETVFDRPLDSVYNEGGIDQYRRCEWGIMTRAEAAGDELDAETLRKMFRAQARAVEVLEKDPSPFVKYFVAETGGLIEERDFQSSRLLHGPPTPYTRERFDDEYNWTVKWNMTVPNATFENTVDNRAWE